MSDEYYDEDGFRLEFEDDTSDQEKQFFMRAFPNVNKIAERKVHCTSCYMHIGTAPITEAIIRMHPVLRVSHCRNCHTFYNSGEFDKGEDGSELYCRWCGQGGEVYCCSKCPYVFCKKCIVQNLSRACVQDISRNDNWQCFSCAPKIMWHLRAQHWALVNYIEKQKKDMKDKNLSVTTINNLMKQDNTTCCSGKGLNKKSAVPIAPKKPAKRPSDANDFSPGAAKIPDNKRQQVTPRPMLPVQQSGTTPPSAKKAKTDNNEVVCTPDIMSMFMSPEEPPPLVATRTLPPAAKPTPPKPTPPPAMPTTVPGRQVVVRPAMPANQAPVTMRMPAMANSANNAPPPVYHTINGYRIDLHTAAQQGTYRLPNGKLIQVRKQAPTAPPTPNAIPATRNIAPKPTNTYFNPVSVPPATSVRMTNGGNNMHINIALQQQQQLQEQRLQQQRQQQQQQQQQQQMIQQQRQQQLLMQQAQAGHPQPTIVAGQINPALQLPTLALLQNMVNGPHEDSPLGKSRKNFEGKLLSGVEICQHIVNKINTLTNSNSFKNIRNVRDLKELYIHVSYLLTYAIGRFKTLQEKCVDDVKKMGFTKESDFVMMGEQISNRNPGEDKSDDEDDCEIIETNTTLIELDSEDEDDGGKKKKDDQAGKSVPCPKETEAAVAAILQEKDDANTSTEPIAVDSDERIAPAETESPSKDDTATDKSETETATSDDTSAKEIVSVDSTETVADQSIIESNKSDDDLVEIVDGDDNVEPQAEVLDKPEEASVAAEDGEDANKEVVQTVESTEAEQAQNKTDDTADKDDAVVVALSDEDKQETGDVTNLGDPEQGKAEKDDAAVTSEQETKESTEAEVAKEEKSNEEQDTEMQSAEVEKIPEDESVDASKEDESEMESAEVEKTPEVESVEASKDDENEKKSAEVEKTSEGGIVDISEKDKSESKENELPKEDLTPAESGETVEEKEADKNEAGEQAEQSEAMVVDAQHEDKVESSIATEEETKPSESEDEPVSTDIIEENSLAEPEQSVEDHESSEAPETGPCELESEVAESRIEASTDDDHLGGQHDPESPQMPQISAVQSAVDLEIVEPTVESSTTEETSVEESPSNEASAVEVAPVEDCSEAAIAALDTPVEEMLDAPTGNDLLAQIEDSFLKLQEMIESTEEATANETEETSADHTEEAIVDQTAEAVDHEMTEEANFAAQSEEESNEQMEVDEDDIVEETAAVSITEEESQGAISDAAGSSAAENTVEQQLLAECNGALEDNGTIDSNGLGGDLDEMADALGDEMLEISKMATAPEVENINSPEMISGDY